MAVVAVVSGIVGWWLRRKDRVQQQLQDVEVDRRLRGRSEIENELKAANVDRTAELEALAVEITAEAEERLRVEEAHVAQIDERRARLAGLVGR